MESCVSRQTSIHDGTNAPCAHVPLDRPSVWRMGGGSSPQMHATTGRARFLATVAAKLKPRTLPIRAHSELCVGVPYHAHSVRWWGSVPAPFDLLTTCPRKPYGLSRAPLEGDGLARLRRQRRSLRSGIPSPNPKSLSCECSPSDVPTTASALCRSTAHRSPTWQLPPLVFM